MTQAENGAKKFACEEILMKPIKSYLSKQLFILIKRTENVQKIFLKLY